MKETFGILGFANNRKNGSGGKCHRFSFHRNPPDFLIKNLTHLFYLELLKYYMPTHIFNLVCSKLALQIKVYPCDMIFLTYLSRE